MSDYWRLVMRHFLSLSLFKAMVNTDLIHEDIERSGLADATKRHYHSKLRAFERSAAFPKDIMQSVGQVNKSGKASSETAYLTFLLGVSRISGEMKKALGTQARELMKRVDVLTTQSSDERRERKTREGDVAWEDLLECGKHFTDEDTLIHALYTQVPPQRADYAEMEIVPSRSQVKDESRNYYLKKEGAFLFQSYKSANRYGPKTVRVPPTLKKMLNALDQKYVLQAFDGAPYQPNTLSQKVIRMFKRACGMHVTINTLRRSWAAMSMRGNPTDEQVAEYASQLDHSTATHRGYAFMT